MWDTDDLISDNHTLDYVLERIHALDEWISNGNFPPDGWDRRR